MFSQSIFGSQPLGVSVWDDQLARIGGRQSRRSFQRGSPAPHFGIPTSAANIAGLDFAAGFLVDASALIRRINSETSANGTRHRPFVDPGRRNRTRRSIPARSDSMYQ